MTLRSVHVAWAWVVVVGNGLAGAWALGAHWLDRLRRRELWWFVAVVQVAIFVQVALGALLLQEYRGDHVRMHMFYGFVAAFTVAIVYSYRAQLREHRYLLYGLGGLFLMGLGIRAMVLDPG